MVRRDVLGRYRGSFGGVFWTVLNPLLLMLTYFFVFGVVLEARFGNDPSRSGFVLYFLAGMLPWLAFSEAGGPLPYVILEHRNFVKKLVFPVETLPVIQVIAGLVTEVFALGVFIVGLFLARGAVPASIVWLPVLIVPQLLFTPGCAGFWPPRRLRARPRPDQRLPADAVVLPDAHLLSRRPSLPAWAVPMLSKNPIFVLVRGYREIFSWRGARRRCGACGSSGWWPWWFLSPGTPGSTSCGSPSPTSCKCGSLEAPLQ